MAKIKSNFQCMKEGCKEILQFPNDVGIVDFTILFLEFYKKHEGDCENDVKRPNEPAVMAKLKRGSKKK